MFEPHNQPYFSKVYLKNRLKNALRYIGIEDYGLTKAFYVNLIKLNNLINLGYLNSFLFVLRFFTKNSFWNK